MDSPAMLVMTTCGSPADADALATALVESGQAACVNRLDSVRSTYRWDGAVETDDEVLVLIKTTEAGVTAVRETVHAMAKYELPEFLTVRVEGGSAAYLDWLAGAVGEV
jgi:periplasmic divalent cation tolerance protein